MIQAKRVYDKPRRQDGYRVLVDKLWPRGRRKSDVPLDEWSKELAPSTPLRKRFGHDPKRWKEFRTEFLQELRNPEAKKKLEHLAQVAKKRNLTLLYSAADVRHNNAVVLKQVLQRKLRS